MWLKVGVDNLVECIAEIRNNETNEIVEYNTLERLEDDEIHPSTFNWEENNYSCDCNRRIFFKGKNVTEEDYNIECSDGKFSVNLKNKNDGKVYYREF